VKQISIKMDNYYHSCSSKIGKFNISRKSLPGSNLPLIMITGGLVAIFASWGLLFCAPAVNETNPSKIMMRFFIGINEEPIVTIGLFNG
jgi:hypothetical protein